MVRINSVAFERRSVDFQVKRNESSEGFAPCKELITWVFHKYSRVARLGSVFTSYVTVHMYLVSLGSLDLSSCHNNKYGWYIDYIGYKDARAIQRVGR